MASPADVTALLVPWSRGTRSALKQLHSAARRGDGVPSVPIAASNEAVAVDEIPILALDLGLQRLAQLDADLVRIGELRAFGGLTIASAND